MTALALELPVRYIIIGTESDVIVTDASELLGSELSGFAFSAEDDSMEVRDMITPANNYVGSAVAKFGTARASTGTYYDADGLVQTSASGLRRDHNPRNAGVPMYLIEDAQTNYLTYGTTLSAWSIQGDLVWSGNATTAPDGTLTASKFAETTTVVAGRSFYNTVTPIPVDGNHTFSIYLKAAGRNWVYVRLDPGGPVLGAWFDIFNGTVGTVSSGVTASIQPAVNGWYRCLVTRSLLVSGGFVYTSVQLGDADDSSVYAGVVGNGVYPWGAQLELADSATSVIPTVAVTVTRAKDVPYILSTALPYHDYLGTMSVWSVCLTNTNARLVSFMKDDFSNQINIHNVAPAGCWTEIYEAAVRVFGIEVDTGPKTSPHKTVMAWSPTDSNAAFDGSTRVADDAAGAYALPVDRFKLGHGAYDAGQPLALWIASVMYSPRRMSNDEIEVMSVP